MLRFSMTVVMAIFMVITVTEGSLSDIFKDLAIKSKEKTETVSILDIVAKDPVKMMIYDYLGGRDTFKFSFSVYNSSKIEKLDRDLAVACRTYWFSATTKFLFSHWQCFMNKTPTTSEKDDALFVDQVNQYVLFNPGDRFSESFLSLYKLMHYVWNLAREDSPKAAEFFQKYQKTNQFWCVYSEVLLPSFVSPNYTPATYNESFTKKVNAVGYCMYNATLRFLVDAYINPVIIDLLIPKLPANIGITLKFDPDDPHVTSMNPKKLFFSFLLVNFKSEYPIPIFFDKQDGKKKITFAIYDKTMNYMLMVHCQTDEKKHGDEFYVDEFGYTLWKYPSLGEELEMDQHFDHEAIDIRFFK